MSRFSATHSISCSRSFIADFLRCNCFIRMEREYGFIPFQSLDSLLVIPQARHQPLGPRYLQTSMQGLFFRLLTSPDLALGDDSSQRFVNAILKLAKTRELFEESLLEILEVQREGPNADGVATSHSLVAFPAPNPGAF